MKLSNKALAVKESSTLKIAALAKKLKEDGVDIVSFSAGEPDFNTPEHINKAAIEAINSGFTKYTPSSGIDELRKAICKKLKEDNNLEYDYTQIVVSNGAKHSLSNIFYAILQDGDEVIIPAPYWLSYAEMIGLAGGKTVVVYTKEENGLKITKEQLNSAYTEKTKAIVINSPCNPSGVVYSKEDLQAIADFAVEKDLLVISDEIYEKLIFNDKLQHVSIASLNDEIFKRTIVVNGFSKSYSMTGWRVGYTASTKEIASVMGNVQSHCASNPNSIAQKAALAALTSSQNCVEEMCVAFKERRDYIYDRVINIPGISAVKPEGAFYVFADISKLCGKEINGKLINDGGDFAEVLLNEASVAIVPGEDFGYKNCIRLSYSTDIETIKKGMDRIEDFVKKHY